MDHIQKALFLLLVLVALFLQANYLGFMLDDPYISFRYAHNLINGHGLEFNVGERVEGYTNFLWTILLAGLMGLGGDPVLASKVLGVALSCGTLILVFLLHRKVLGESDNRFRPLLSVGLVATSCYFNLWTVGGLETPLYTVLLLAGLWCFLHERDHRQFPVSGFVFSLLCMTRPEGVIFVAVAGFCVLHSVLKHRKASHHDFIWALEFLAIYGCYFIWRASYYGMMLPNTYYAKMGGGGAKYLLGLEYIGSFAMSNGMAALVVMAVGLLAFVALSCRRLPSTMVLAALAAQLLFIVYAGGDWMPGYRFFVPILPLLAIMTVEGLQPVLRSVLESALLQRVTREAAICGVCVLGVVSSMVYSNHLQLRGSIPWLSSWFESLSLSPEGPYYEVATFLNVNAASGDTIALGEAGIIPYFCPQLRFVDYLGIVDTHISHLSGLLHYKSDAEYVLKRSPGWVVLTIAVDRAGAIRWAMPPVQQFLDSKCFEENYQLVQRIKRGQLGDLLDYFYVYRKNQAIFRANSFDFAESLETAVIADNGRTADNPWRAWVAKDRFTVAGEGKHGIYAAAPSWVGFEVPIPANTGAILRFSIGIFEGAWNWGSDGVRFQVTVAEEATESTLFDRYLDPAAKAEDRRWQDFAIDLTKFAGKRVVITFVTRNDQGRNENADWSIWGNPMLDFTKVLWKAGKVVTESGTESGDRTGESESRDRTECH